MLGLAPDYDHLMVIQKVEVFEHALESTSGEDLHKVRRPGAGGWNWGRRRLGIVAVAVTNHGCGGCAPGRWRLCTQPGYLAAPCLSPDSTTCLC